MSTTAASRPRVLSGIQPDFGLHLGNYLGALRNWARDQDRYENYFCIVDLHALTRHPDPERLRALTLELAAMYIACGLDPARCEIFVQSHVPAHSQMCWILETLTPMGWLERMTQFKARSEAQGRRAGQHRRVHLPGPHGRGHPAVRRRLRPGRRGPAPAHRALTRDLAQRLNSQRGDVVRVPAPLISTVGARVMGLDTPDEKMSKSIAVDRPGHAVLLLDPPDVVRRKIARATTDTEPAVHAPVGAGVANLLEIYAALREISPDAALAEFDGKRYSVLKGAVADAVIDALSPIQARYADASRRRATVCAACSPSPPRACAWWPTRPCERVQEAVGLR